MDADDPIKHVVLLMLENHSFDQMLGSLKSEYPELDGVDIESPSALFNVDQLGNKISPWVAARVEKTLFDHTSLLKYLTDKWRLGPLGARTAAANSIGVALRDEKRVGLLPFIRIPYTELMLGKPELEKEDRSTHHEAI